MDSNFDAQKLWLFWRNIKLELSKNMYVMIDVNLRWLD